MTAHRALILFWMKGLRANDHEHPKTMRYVAASGWLAEVKILPMYSDKNIHFDPGVHILWDNHHISLSCTFNSETEATLWALETRERLHPISREMPTLDDMARMLFPEDDFLIVRTSEENLRPCSYKLYPFIRQDGFLYHKDNNSDAALLGNACTEGLCFIVGNHNEAYSTGTLKECVVEKVGQMAFYWRSSKRPPTHNETIPPPASPEFSPPLSV